MVVDGRILVPRRVLVQERVSGKRRCAAKQEPRAVGMGLVRLVRAIEPEREDADDERGDAPRASSPEDGGDHGCSSPDGVILPGEGSGILPGKDAKPPAGRPWHSSGSAG